MAETSLTLGVLGGMGPAATLEFLTKLQAYTPAEKDQDHGRQAHAGANPLRSRDYLPGDDTREHHGRDRIERRQNRGYIEPGGEAREQITHVARSIEQARDPRKGVRHRRWKCRTRARAARIAVSDPNHSRAVRASRSAGRRDLGPARVGVPR